MARSGKSCAATAINADAINADGECSIHSTARMFQTADGSSNKPAHPYPCPTSIPVLAQHRIYEDAHFIAGLSRHPATPGHTLVVLKALNALLLSLESGDFSRFMLQIAYIASKVRKFYDVGRCALVTEGGNLLSILPLHGSSRE